MKERQPKIGLSKLCWLFGVTRQVYYQSFYRDEFVGIEEELEVFHYGNKLKFLHTVNSEKYVFNAEFKNPYLTGSWKDTKGIGYEGTFQMKLNGQGNKFEGMWIGWSNASKIKSDVCELTKI